MDWTVSRLITVSLPIIILKKIKSSLKYWKTEVTPPPALKDALWTKLHFIHSDFRFSSDYKTSFLEHLQQKPFLCFFNVTAPNRDVWLQHSFKKEWRCSGRPDWCTLGNALETWNIHSSSPACQSRRRWRRSWQWAKPHMEVPAEGRGRE